MNLNSAHERFSPELELLMLLPIAPRFTCVDTLAIELELEDRKRVYYLARRLAEMGINFIAACKNRQHLIAIARESANDAAFTGQQYWDQLYQGDSWRRPRAANRDFAS